jgi:hypothetical protein
MFREELWSRYVATGNVVAEDSESLVLPLVAGPGRTRFGGPGFKSAGRVGDSWRMIAVAAALSAWLVVAHGEVSTSGVEPCGDAQQVREWVDGLNVRRGQTSPCVTRLPFHVLRWEPHLASSAQDLAVSLALSGSLSHVDSAGRTFAQRLHLAGYRPAAAAENLAAGQDNFADVLEAWIGSPSHCANLMSADLTEVGIACVRRAESTYRWFWVAQFGKPIDRRN